MISTQVDGRLAEDTLYFERTGWNDGFMARKDPDAAKRDAQARAAQTAPQLAILRRCTAYAAGIAALSTAGFVIFQVPARPHVVIVQVCAHHSFKTVASGL